MDTFLAELTDRYVAAKARVSTIKGQYDSELQRLHARFNKAFADAKEEFLALETILRLEEKKNGVQSDEGSTQRLPLAEFFLTALHANGPLSKDDLRDQAERVGYFADGDPSGRTVHVTLLNLCRAGRVVEVGSGIYTYPPAVMKEAAE